MMTDSSMLPADPEREWPRYPFAEWERECEAREGRRTSEEKEMGELRVEVMAKSYEQEETGEARVLLWAKGLDPLRIMECGRE